MNTTILCFSTSQNKNSISRRRACKKRKIVFVTQNIESIIRGVQQFCLHYEGYGLFWTWTYTTTKCFTIYFPSDFFLFFSPTSSNPRYCQIVFFLHYILFSVFAIISNAKYCTFKKLFQFFTLDCWLYISSKILESYNR